MLTMGKRNTISGKFVNTGTINRPLRLRSERGKTHSPFKKHYQIENEKYTQRTLHKGYSLRNIYATNIQKGVGDRFIAPASSTKTIDYNLQNITDCNAYNGKTQHHLGDFRGHGHDKSAPTPTG